APAVEGFADVELRSDGARCVRYELHYLPVRKFFGGVGEADRGAWWGAGAKRFFTHHDRGCRGYSGGEGRDQGSGVDARLESWMVGKGESITGRKVCRGERRLTADG